MGCVLPLDPPTFYVIFTALLSVEDRAAIDHCECKFYPRQSSIDFDDESRYVVRLQAANKAEAEGAVIKSLGRKPACLGAIAAASPAL